MRFPIAFLALALAAGAPALANEPPTEAAQVEGQLEAIRAALHEEVPSAMPAEPDQAATLLRLARQALTVAGETVDRPQLMMVVDRNPQVQRIALVLAAPDRDWELLALEKTSTGQANRRGYFITPLGVFLHTTAIRDYRAEGTKNEFGIRGLGARGSRVWDFGWNRAQPGWLPPAEPPREMRLLLHATDPDYLEQRLGQPASMGCIRISAALNRFLDRRGVLDAEHEASVASGDPRHVAVLRPDREPTPLAGRMLVVVDSAEQG